MPVPLSLLVGLVADPLVNKPLVDPFARTCGYETVPQTVKAACHRPRAATERPLEMVVGLVPGDGGDRHPSPLRHVGRTAALRGCPGFLASVARGSTPRLAAGNGAAPAEQERPAGMHGQPRFQHALEEGGERHAAGGPSALTFFLLTDQH